MNPLLSTLEPIERLGEIKQQIGLKLVAHGPPNVFVGELCEIVNKKNEVITQAEVIGFEEDNVFLIPFANINIHQGFKVRARGTNLHIRVGPSLLGRVVNAFGIPLDQQPFALGTIHVPLIRSKINPLDRQPITERLATGIHAIDCLLPLGKGQRMGLFAGSGVGKSVLLGMMARQIQSDINIIALIGERGREVNDFIQEYLDENTIKKSIIVVASSDEPAILRKQAAYTAMALAEYFCSQQHDVMLFMDSVTRFAMAQRELGLSLNELPSIRGYTPSVFSLLPGIIERAGNFIGQGSITALYTVLVENDDFNEPITDTLRALLDGHIILSRELAHRGHYPAIDILQSISRLAHQLFKKEEQALAFQIKELVNEYQKNYVLIDMGAYKSGTNAKLDRAVERIEHIYQLLKQNQENALPLTTLSQQFSEILQ